MYLEYAHTTSEGSVKNKKKSVKFTAKIAGNTAAGRFCYIVSDLFFYNLQVLGTFLFNKTQCNS